MASPIFINMSGMPNNSSECMNFFEKFVNEMKAELNNSTKSASMYFSYDFEQDTPILESKRFVWELYPKNFN